LYTVWGNLFYDGLPRTEREFRAAEAAIDPTFGDGLYYGLSAGHTDSKAAGLRGMPRAYGTGGVMFAYVVDYATNWAGERGAILHCNIPYRSPVLVGDVTVISGTVAAIDRDNERGFGTVTIDVQLADQDGDVLTRGQATVQLPIEE
jgi:acyl dehydratase